MKISDKSIKLFNFFSKYHIVSISPLKKNAKHVIDELYVNIMESFEYIHRLQLTLYCKIKYKEIKSSSEIRYPKNFSLNDFPKEIIEQINNSVNYEICYTFNMLSRNINVYFLLEDQLNIEYNTYNEYIELIISWLYILDKYGSSSCAKTLNIYIYHTSLEKKLPSSNIDIISSNHVNTAFTTTCPINSEIVIFRKEEWFKVLIHETFHNFGLDFSGMNNKKCNETILNIFDVESEVNLYEAYTETWACIINAMYACLLYIDNMSNKIDFYKHFQIFMQLERTFSFFQMVKALKFMGLSYENLYNNEEQDKILRNTLFKENTNVLSYYIIKTILINNYNDFILWCSKNNNQFINFRKSLINIDNFCNYIKKHYKSKSMLKNVNQVSLFFDDQHKLYHNSNHKNKYNKTSNNHHKFLLLNLRMSVCEIE